jgi:nicotinate-nucleotide pyrophosphorylase (carboxylating)
MNLQKNIYESVKLALEEDLKGQSDITALLVPEEKTAEAIVITRENMIFCGKSWVEEVFKQIDPKVKIEWLCNDGDLMKADSTIYKLQGKARSLLTGERTALNFVQMLSGISTMTQEFVKALNSDKTKLLDTRKTIPGLRYAQKYAVKAGGGENHRMGLYDAFLIKENHIASAGSINAAIKKAREIAPDKKVEIETENIEEFKQALNAGADIIMLDNFSIEDIEKAVKFNAGKAKLEVSGDVNLATISRIGQTKVDFVSSGALTKNVKAINLSMRITM